MSTLQSEDTIASQNLSFQTFLWTKNALLRKVTKHEHNSNWFYKLSFPNGLQTIVMLISWISWIACVRSLCMTRVEVEGGYLGWYFGHKRSTYTRVNTVLQLMPCQDHQKQWVTELSSLFYIHFEITGDPCNMIS